MTKEEKELLLKDLCTRLPYGVMMKGVNEDFELSISTPPKRLSYVLNNLEFKHFKPYLRPMSSMTEEEYEELWGICDFRVTSDDYDYFDRYGIQIIQEINNNKGNHQNLSIDFSDFEDLVDWLNAHHFDYRGLIEKGLAFEAPEDMYKN